MSSTEMSPARAFLAAESAAEFPLMPTWDCNNNNDNGTANIVSNRNNPRFVALHCKITTVVCLDTISDSVAFGLVISNGIEITAIFKHYNRHQTIIFRQKPTMMVSGVSVITPGTYNDTVLKVHEWDIFITTTVLLPSTFGGVCIPCIYSHDR